MTKRDVGGGKRTTIYDIAERVGTSPSAVSAVINGSWKQRRISNSLASRILLVAKETSYAPNLAASNLRRTKTGQIGMIVPKYDNRYFGSIVEQFETAARARNLFPMVTCTQRDPELEVRAAQQMISHQVDLVISTGATAPDRVSALCHAAGVRSYNLDLPGTLAPSVISDNRGGARDLALRLLGEGGEVAPMLFVGGRRGDHNTSERIQGFYDAHRAVGLGVPPHFVLTTGYAAARAVEALETLVQQDKLPTRIFVNSTIALEGVLSWLGGRGEGDKPVIGCFDWDPMASSMLGGLVMLRQDVPSMISQLFELIDAAVEEPQLIEVKTQLLG